jgi:hypothetical protein
MYLTIAFALLLAVGLAGEAATPGQGPLLRPRVAQPTTPSQAVLPGAGDPATPAVNAPSAGFIVQQLSPQATGEVEHDIHVLDGLAEAANQRRRELAGFVDWAHQYRNSVLQAAVQCRARTYSAADNVTAGCGNRDTPATCERKLLDWCMHRRDRFKAIRDPEVHRLKNTALWLQGVVTQYADQVYPR